MNNRDRYDRGTQRQSSPGRRRRESANSTGQGLTLDLVKDLAKLRDNEPHRFPAAYERLKVNLLLDAPTAGRFCSYFVIKAVCML